MRRYLRTVSVEEALNMLFNRFKPWEYQKTEVIDTRNALKRVTAEPVFALRSVPHYHGAAMDGIALDARKTFGASESHPIRLKLGLEAFWVDTGDPLPDGTNSVVPVEEVHIEDGEVELIKAAYPWQHVRVAGEDVVKGEMLFTRNHFLRPEDLALLLASGVRTLKVKKRPRVFFIPTGDELRDPFLEELKPGEIPEFNSKMIEGLLEELGAEFRLLGPIKDKQAELVAALDKAIAEDADLVIVNAGSSYGRDDHTYTVLEKNGEVLFHGISLMPGRPTLAGSYKQVAVIGLPGYPLSAFMAFKCLVEPMLLAMLGQIQEEGKTVKAILAENLPSRLGVEEAVRIKLHFSEEGLVAHPLPRGASVLSSLSRADGILQVPANIEGFSEGREVEVSLRIGTKALKRSILIVGSDDLALNVIADCLKELYPPIALSIKPTGSLGGLIALTKGYCLLATCHLLDPESGHYNIQYIKRYLKDIDVIVIRLFWRQQGLILRKGNPHDVKGLEDLMDGKLRFVNRQRGSGTRILLDHLLTSKGLERQRIMGYNEEVPTHMAVAMAVKDGRADVGLGIRAAASALDLDFLPLVKEPFDLVLPKKALEDERVKGLLEVLSSQELRERIEALGGYDLSELGERVWP